MSRKPSEKTQLATARRQIKQQDDELRRTRAELATQRGRAERAEKELAEWKTRFDKLLEFRRALKLPQSPE